MTVKKEFLVERQGKSFVLYAGLLDLAHSQGLRRIETELIQVPSENNGQTAIFKAWTETDRGTFYGWGDASPANVSRQMLTCTIRLAETRAKARALRDAVNVGVAALEELGDDHEDIGQGQTVDKRDGVITERPKPAASANPEPVRQFDQRTVPHRSASAPVELASTAQVRAIYAIGRQTHNLNEEEIEEWTNKGYGVKPAELSKRQASEFITQLKGGAA